MRRVPGTSRHYVLVDGYVPPTGQVIILAWILAQTLSDNLPGIAGHIIRCKQSTCSLLLVVSWLWLAVIIVSWQTNRLMLQYVLRKLCKPRNMLVFARATFSFVCLFVVDFGRFLLWSVWLVDCGIWLALWQSCTVLQPHSQC